MLGVKYTDDQCAVARDFLDETVESISAKSGHGTGKSNLAACQALWFKYTHTPSLVITTAPTERQVKEILWREIRYRFAGASQKLEGTILKMMLDIDPINYMFGFSTNDVQKIQGFHSANILFIIDEANGFPIELYEAVYGVLSGGERRILFQIGNPIDPIGPFFESFSDGITKCHTLSCLDHPNVVTGTNVIPGAVTRDWIEKQRSRWGEDSAFWQSRVLGEFPKISTDIVVNLGWVETAEIIKPKKRKKNEAIYMGVDVAEYGSDPSAWFVGTEHKRIYNCEKHNVEPTETGNITRQLRRRYSVPYENVSVDGIGVGAGVYSYLKENEGGLASERDGWRKLNRFVASERAIDHETFEDKSIEAWWIVRNMLKPDSDNYKGYALCGRTDKLKADLCTRKYKTSGKGKMRLEPKEEYRKRLKRSPDNADAMVICYSKLAKRRVYGYVVLPNVMNNNW